jgi:hypothetical protein
MTEPYAVNVLFCFECLPSFPYFHLTSAPIPDSSVGIAAAYGLNDRDVGVRVPVGSKFSLLQAVQTGSGVQITSYPVGTGGFSPGVKRQGREADHSPSTSAEVKKMWTYIHSFIRFHGVVLN